MPHSKSFSEMRRRAKKHLQAWRKSGLSKSEYCRSRGIPLRTFFGWCQKHLPFDQGTPPSGHRDQIFELVPVPSRLISGRASSFPGENENRLSIEFGSHIKIVVTQEFSPALLDKVIRTLEGTR